MTPEEMKELLGMDVKDAIAHIVVQVDDLGRMINILTEYVTAYGEAKIEAAREQAVQEQYESGGERQRDEAYD